jgi:hypothetical protein
MLHLDGRSRDEGNHHVPRLPATGSFRSGTGEGRGMGRSNCKGYLDLQLDWSLREATLRFARAQLDALTRRRGQTREPGPAEWC